MTAHPANALFHKLTEISERQKRYDELAAISRRAMTTKIVSIESLCGLPEKKGSYGNDELVEFSDRDQDYQEQGGMKR